jgi:deoxycytidylate deaminase
MPTTSTQYEFDWADLAFGSKKAVKDLQAIFIAASREMSTKRFKEIVATYLPKGNIVLGLAKEPYVLGLENQPQFKMLQQEMVQAIVDKVNRASTKHKIYTLRYNQRDLVFILEKANFARALFVNGSWYHGFHLRPEYYVLAKQRTPYELISPFADDAEARNFASTTKLSPVAAKGVCTDREMIEFAQAAARHSYDYASFQTGAALGRRKGMKYELLATSHNQIVPYETYAMHFGSERERYFSPTHDLNHYDTIHFEVAMLIQAQKRKLDLTGATLFANVLPCPHCSHMLAATDIAELVYSEDHSAGYAIQMLEAAGKKVRRIVPALKSTI